MNPIKIYTVDDYLLSRVAHKNYFLSDKKYKIIGDFVNAFDCFEALKGLRPDIILMDVELPYMNGIEATRVIKEKYPKIKVIIFSIHESDKYILGALAAGACGYILKNNPNIDLKKIIKIVMEGGFFMDLEMASAAFSKIPFQKEDINKEIIENLTERELEVLKLMIEGKTNSQIAQEMIVSTNTAKAHVGRILYKLSVTDRVQAVVKALKFNLV